jgi:hypothetical protein
MLLFGFVCADQLRWRMLYWHPDSEICEQLQAQQNLLTEFAGYDGLLPIAASPFPFLRPSKLTGSAQSR